MCLLQNLHIIRSEMLCSQFIGSLSIFIMALTILSQSVEAEIPKKGIQTKKRVSPKGEIARNATTTTPAPVDYCAFQCGKNHIACNNNGSPGPHCPPNVRSIKMDDHTKSLILTLHNEKRNEVAGGNLNHLPTAARMGLMQWDNELAHLAEIKAFRCSATEDQCHVTERFQNPGQNIAHLVYQNETDKFLLKNLVENRIKEWFSSSSQCNAETITKPNDKNYPPNIYRFTLAVIDKSTRIGCGAVHFEVETKNYFHMVCNYAYKNKNYEPVYKTGDPACDCKTGKDKKYRYLCSSKEKYEI